MKRSDFSTGSLLAASKLGQVRKLPLNEIQPSPENDSIYHPAHAEDPGIISLAVSIKKIGLKEPIVITRDRYIMSGHRRYAACRLLGLKSVGCRVENIARRTCRNFEQLLREYNRQRVKSFDEVFREELVSTDPEKAHQALIEHRRKAVKHDAQVIDIRDPHARASISAAKAPMLKAICKIIEERSDYWPLSDRQVHYALLNDPPCKHASKPESQYMNDTASYKSLTELITRARLEGIVPWEAISDETRPVTTWAVHRDPSTFIQEHLVILRAVVV